eukprot:comp23311_c0_seq1/m.38310 comp23311_c0_seq1/g.38310  ORF comp23311_c0_seq1/g.38310 comp23311_c0_seq1/m.38310 type:complete len:597 (-) comp23311_c0_seq1:692-2482(-)
MKMSSTGRKSKDQSTGRAGLPNTATNTASSGVSATLTGHQGGMPSALADPVSFYLMLQAMQQAAAQYPNMPLANGHLVQPPQQPFQWQPQVHGHMPIPPQTFAPAPALAGFDPFLPFTLPLSVPMSLAPPQVPIIVQQDMSVGHQPFSTQTNVSTKSERDSERRLQNAGNARRGSSSKAARKQTSEPIQSNQKPRLIAPASGRENTERRGSIQSNVETTCAQSPMQTDRPASVSMGNFHTEASMLAARVFETAKTKAPSPEIPSLATASPGTTEGSRSHEEGSMDVDSPEFTCSGTLSPSTRRALHIRAEQRRRQNINSGFEELQTIVPECGREGGTRVSKATVLGKAIDYIGYLLREKTGLMGEVDRLRKEVHQLRCVLAHYQTMGTAPDVEGLKTRSNGEAPPHTEQTYINRDHIKFYVFCQLVDKLYETFSVCVSLDNAEVFSSSLLAWFDKYCRPDVLRDTILRALLALGSRLFTEDSARRIKEWGGTIKCLQGHPCSIAGRQQGALCPEAGQNYRLCRQHVLHGFRFAPLSTIAHFVRNVKLGTGMVVWVWMSQPCEMRNFCYSRRGGFWVNDTVMGLVVMCLRMYAVLVV